VIDLATYGKEIFTSPLFVPVPLTSEPVKNGIPEI
jgi:hypothetical protein